jgi:hypothetical protein
MKEQILLLGVDMDLSPATHPRRKYRSKAINKISG